MFESWLSISSVRQRAPCAHDRSIARRFRPVPMPRPTLDFPAPQRADAARGVYETLLVATGGPFEQRRHLERLAASLRDALRRGAAGAARERLAAAWPTVTRSPGCGSEARRRARGRAATALVAATPSRAAIDAAVVLPGGGRSRSSRSACAAAPGAHKLRRPLLARADRGDSPAPSVRPLLVSRSGELLETTRANVFLVRDGVLATPPLDGTILPGTARAALLEHARALRRSRPTKCRSTLRGARRGRRRAAERLVAPARTGRRRWRAAQQHWLPSVWPTRWRRRCSTRHSLRCPRERAPGHRRGLILSHGDEAPAALLEEWLREHGCDYVVHDVTAAPLPSLEGFAFVASLGSVSSANGHRPGLGAGGDRAAARSDRGRRAGARRSASAARRCRSRWVARSRPRQSHRSAGSSSPSASTRCRPARGFTGTTSSSASRPVPLRSLTARPDQQPSATAAISVCSSIPR